MAFYTSTENLQAIHDGSLNCHGVLYAENIKQRHATGFESVKRFSFKQEPAHRRFATVQEKEGFLLRHGGNVAKLVNSLKKRIPTQWLDSVYSTIINGISQPGRIITIDFHDSLFQETLDQLYRQFPETMQWANSGYCPDLHMQLSSFKQLNESFFRAKKHDSIYVHYKYIKDNHPHQHAIRHAQIVNAVGFELGLDVSVCKNLNNEVRQVACDLQKRQLDNFSAKLNRGISAYVKPVDICESNRKDRIRRYNQVVRKCQQETIECMDDGGIVLFITMRLPKTLHAVNRLQPYLVDVERPTNKTKTELLHDIHTATLKRTVKNQSVHRLGIGGLWRVEPHYDETPHTHMLICFPDAVMAAKYVENLHEIYAEKTKPFRIVSQMMPDGSDEMVLGVGVDAIDVRSIVDRDSAMRNPIYNMKNIDKAFPDLLQWHRSRRFNVFGTFRNNSKSSKHVQKTEQLQGEIPVSKVENQPQSMPTNAEPFPTEQNGSFVDGDFIAILHREGAKPYKKTLQILYLDRTKYTFVAFACIQRYFKPESRAPPFKFY